MVRHIDYGSVGCWERAAGIADEGKEVHAPN